MTNVPRGRADRMRVAPIGQHQFRQTNQIDDATDIHLLHHAAALKSITLGAGGFALARLSTMVTKAPEGLVATLLFSIVDLRRGRTRRLVASLQEHPVAH